MLTSGLPRSIPGQHFLRNLFERRTLIYQLVKRDFHQRYVGSAAGWLWSIIHPLVLLASYTFIFSVCLKTQPPADAPTQNYPMFLFAGMLPWLLFAETVQRASGSLVEQANLITKTVFPSEIVAVAIFLSTLTSHLLAVLLFAIGAAIFTQHVTVAVLVLPVFALLLGMFAIGLGWVTSSLHVYLRDTAQVVAVALTFWLWITPIFIAESQFPAAFRFLLRLNPISYAVRAYRDILLGGVTPPAATFTGAAIFAIAAFLIGGLFFRWMKKGFADVL